MLFFAPPTLGDRTHFFLTDDDACEPTTWAKALNPGTNSTDANPNAATVTIIPLRIGNILYLLTFSSTASQQKTVVLLRNIF